MDDFPAVEIQHFDGVVPERGDKQTMPRGVAGEMIDPPLDVG